MSVALIRFRIGIFKLNPSPLTMDLGDFINMNELILLELPNEWRRFRFTMISVLRLAERRQLPHHHPAAGISAAFLWESRIAPPR